MTTSDIGAPIEVDLDRAERFYTKLRRRISDSFARGGGLAGGVGEVVLLLPDFFALVLRLIQDPRLTRSTRLELAAALAYVLSPVDLIPDFLFPIGYVDDAIALALALSRFAKLTGEAGEQILQEHWEGESSVLHAITSVTSAADGVLNERVVKQLRRRFGGQ